MWGPHGADLQGLSSLQGVLSVEDDFSDQPDIRTSTTTRKVWVVQSLRMGRSIGDIVWRVVLLYTILLYDIRGGSMI